MVASEREEGRKNEIRFSYCFINEWTTNRLLGKGCIVRYVVPCFFTPFGCRNISFPGVRTTPLIAGRVQRYWRRLASRISGKSFRRLCVSLTLVFWTARGRRVSVWQRRGFLGGELFRRFGVSRFGGWTRGFLDFLRRERICEACTCSTRVASCWRFRVVTFPCG